MDNLQGVLGKVCRHEQFKFNCTLEGFFRGRCNDLKEIAKVGIRKWRQSNHEAVYRVERDFGHRWTCSVGKRVFGHENSVTCSIKTSRKVQNNFRNFIKMLPKTIMVVITNGFRFWLSKIFPNIPTPLSVGIIICGWKRVEVVTDHLPGSELRQAWQMNKTCHLTSFEDTLKDPRPL